MKLNPHAQNPAALKGWRLNIRFALAALRFERDDAKLPPAKRSRYGVHMKGANIQSNEAMLARLLPKRHMGANYK